MKKLIVNGDDFGLHPSVNKAIIQAYRLGCLKSTSFMPAGRVAEAAAALALKEPELSVGLHFTLVGAKLVSPVEKIPSLVDENGLFPADYGVFIGKYLRGRIKLREVAAECEAQLLRMEELGLRTDHFDSHQHLHALPGITEVCLEAIQRHGIKRMRCPAEGCFFRGGLSLKPIRFALRGGLTFLAQYASRKDLRQGIRMPEHFFEMLSGGQMTGKNLRRIIRELPEGISEVMVHPGRTGKSWRRNMAGAIAGRGSLRPLRRRKRWNC